MKKYLELSKKYIRTNKKRTITTILAIMLSTAVMLSFNMVYKAQEKNNKEKAKEQIGYYDVTFEKLTNEQYEKLKKDNRVSNIARAKMDGALIATTNNYKTNYNFVRLTDEAFENVFKFDLMQGRLPENDNEILVDYKTIGILGDSVKVGSEVSFGKYDDAEAIDVSRIQVNLGELELLQSLKNTDDLKASRKDVVYKVVGITRSVTAKNRIYGYIDKNKLTESGQIDTFATIENNQVIGYGGVGVGLEKYIAKDLGLKFLAKTSKIGTGIFSSQVRYPDSSVIEVRGQGINDGNASLIIFIVTLFMFGTIFNIFNISVLERIRHIGILRAIGSERKQISKIIGRESNFYLLVGIPLGIVLGFVSTKGIIRLITSIMDISFNISDVVVIPIDIIKIVVIVFIIVKISARFAVSKQVKMTPLEAMSTFTSDKESKVDVVGSNKFIEEKGKIETKLAHKNLYRNITRNNICTLSIAVSMILFMVFTTSFVTGLQNIKTTTPSKNWDVEISETNSKLSEVQIDKLKNVNGVRNVYHDDKIQIGIPIKKSSVSGMLDEAYNSKNLKHVSREYRGYYATNATIRIVSEEELGLYNEYLTSGNIDYKTLNENGVLLVNSGVKRITTSVSGAGPSTTQKISDEVLDVNVGEEIKIPTVTGLNSKADLESYFNGKDVDEGEFSSFKIQGILKEDALRDTYNKNDESEMAIDYKLVMTKECYDKIFGIPVDSKVVIQTENDNMRDTTISSIREISNSSTNNFKDYGEIAKEEEKKVQEGLAIQITFVITLVIIVIVNVANNFYGSIIMRKKELAAMRAIGMEHSQMKTMVLKEILITAGEAFIWSLAVGGGITLFNQLSLRRLGMARLDFWIISVIASIFIIVMLSLISAIFPLNKLNGLNIVEDMRGEE